MTVRELYEQNVKDLPAAERLRLAAMILNGIPPQAVADIRDDWSEEDLAEFTRGAWERIEGSDDQSG